MTYKKDYSENFVFPPSVQSDLFALLTVEQQDDIRDVLRVLKKPAQEELCFALMDYLETGKRLSPQDFTLDLLFGYFTAHWEPLYKSAPKSVGTILRQVFRGSKQLLLPPSNNH